MRTSFPPGGELFPPRFLGSYNIVEHVRVCAGVAQWSARSNTRAN